MLTSDLVRVRRRGAAIEPRYLRRADADRAHKIAAELLATVSGRVGSTREDLLAALGAVDVGARDRRLAMGLRKLVEDRCEFEVVSSLDPETVRREVFLEAAATRRALPMRGEFDRAAVMRAAAARLGVASPEDLDAALYADLRGSEVLRSFQGISADELLQRYDLALAQAVLLRATAVEVLVEGQAPARYRALFRALRFQGLLHVVRSTPDGYAIDIDGPFSLFDAVQRYGLKLALFLPHLLACTRFRLRAEILWGKAKERCLFALGPEAGLARLAVDPPSTVPDLDGFRDGFGRLDSEWSVAVSDRIFSLPGEVVCVPDLVFENRETGEQVFLEAFGFWSRDAVWRRIELVRKGFPARILLAVRKQLRVSEEVLDEGEAGELYVYGASISPRAVLERLRRRG